MKRKFSLLICIVFILSTLLGPAGAAAADDGSSVDLSDRVVLQSLYEKVKNAEDPDKAFAELSPQAQEALVEGLTKVTYEVTVTEDSPREAKGGLREAEGGPSRTLLLTGGTKRVTITLRGYSYIFHTLLWKYSQVIQWSYDGVYVTAVHDHHSWGVAYWPWSYHGVIGQSESGGAGSTYFRRFSQGKFSFNIGGWPVQTHTPWINQWAYGNGSYSYSAGGY